MSNQIKELLLYGGIFICLAYVIFSPEKDSKPKVETPSLVDFDEHPIVAWLAYDRKGGPCVKVRYEVKRKETKLFMFSESGKLVHQTPISLSPHRDGRKRIETYTWKLYRTEWSSNIDPGFYTVVVGTKYDKRGIGTEIEIL